MSKHDVDEIMEFCAETGARAGSAEHSHRYCVLASPSQLLRYSQWLSDSGKFEFATLVAEPQINSLALRYLFYVRRSPGLLELDLDLEPQQMAPSISRTIPAADWHEREVEDLYGVRFSGHPFLGDFMLHDEDWPESVGPMLPTFNRSSEPPRGGKRDRWRPPARLQEEGAFQLPVGPIWGDSAESALYLLESPGEEIRLAHSRLFYKYRGVEKLSEGKTPEDVLLIAERTSGSAAFAHAIAFCHAVEGLADCPVPPRAQSLRLIFAELERMRWHMSVVSELCSATGLSLGRAMGEELTEKLLRLCQVCTGHRYLFGAARFGGLSTDLGESSRQRLETELPILGDEIARYARWLRASSSFLDRIEQVGTLAPELVATQGLVGPVGRASGHSSDLRWSLSYGPYAQTPKMSVYEQDGDGYARLRVFLREIECSAQLIAATLKSLPDGPVSSACPQVAGVGVGWTEAPAGAAFHWVRLDQNRLVTRWHVAPPSFRNFHALHGAIEGAAFQDFPIILASFGLSVAENDC